MRQLIAAMEVWAARIAHWLEAFIAALFLLVTAAVIGSVVLRYVFNEGIIGSDEAIRIMFIYTTAIGAAVAAGRNDHIAITVGIDLLTPAMRRRMQVLILLLVAVINVFMLWHSLGWIDKTGSYLIPALQLPQFIKQICVPVGCGVAALFCLMRAFCRLGTAPEKSG